MAATLVRFPVFTRSAIDLVDVYLAATARIMRQAKTIADLPMTSTSADGL
jgi:hypothetical protein